MRLRFLVLASSASFLVACASARPKATLEDAVVDHLAPRDEVSFSIPKDWSSEVPAIQDRALVYDQKDGHPIAWLEFHEPREGNRQTGHATLFNSNLVISPGDRIRLTDFTSTEKDFPGQANFLLNGRRDVSSRYKHLAWFGAFVGEGLTLDAKEFLADGFGYVGYGITSRLTVQSWALLSVIGNPNLSLRALVTDESWLKMTAGFSSLYDVYSGQLSSQFRFLLVFPGNSKFTSYTALSIGWTNQLTTPTVPGITTERLILSPNLQSIYEYIFDHWDRIQVGPVYDLKKQALGGFVQYMFIWDRFHLVLGVRTSNFLDFRIDISNAYLPYFSLFWRI